MTTEKKGTKELKELIAGLKEAVKAIKEIRDIVKEMKDGDKAEALSNTLNLVKSQISKVEIYKEAFTGIDEAKAELQDLDYAEMLELFTELLTAIKEIEKA